MDVLGLDVTWTQEFASADWIREWTGDRQGRRPRTARSQAPLESARYEGKLYAAPKNTNIQLLWYRIGPGAEPAEDLGRDDQHRPGAQAGRASRTRSITMGAQYEGLVVLYNNMVASAGGKILNDDGNEGGVRRGRGPGAGACCRSSPRSGVTNPSFTNTQEDDARLQFQGGSGAFQLN